MKLKIGQFIRTPYGIRKIVNITKDDGYGKPRVKVIKLDGFLNTGYKFNYEFYTDEKIIKECKSSFNIIDLIEVGDYVNGSKVLEIEKDYKFIDGTIRDILWTDTKMQKAIWDETIKSIVTKEQFERMKYEVKNRK